MSSHARLAGSTTPPFLDQFFDLERYNSVPNLLAKSLIPPMTRVMHRGINHHPILIRLGAPLAAGLFGVLRVALGVAAVAESTFKGLANLVLAVCTLDIKRCGSAIVHMGFGVIALGLLSLKGIACATFGTVGLIVAPKWTYMNIIKF